MNQDSYDAMGFYTKSAFYEYPEYITAYHVTQSENIPSILATGLIAKPCSATCRGESRTPAVYMFAYKCDAYDNQVRDFLFDDTSDLAVIKIRIPKRAYDNLRYDGLFNISCQCSDSSFPSAIQYTDNIPTDWIEEAIDDQTHQHYAHPGNGSTARRPEQLRDGFGHYQDRD